MSYMINFRAITEDNFDEIIKMRNAAGERYVAQNSVSLAQCWLYRDNGDVFPFAIYNDDEIVGFMLLEEDIDEEKLMLWRMMLWRMMLPEENCGRGYGTEAVRLIVKLAKESGRYRGIYLDCNEENRAAMHVYEKAGFERTGDINYGDAEMAIIFN